MNNYVTKEEKINRNIEKIAEWNGESVNDLIDYLDVISANGGEFDLESNKKDIPSEFSDMEDVEGVFAIDTNGNILYTDLKIGSVEAIRNRKDREAKGLAPLDDFGDKIRLMKQNYTQWAEAELERIKRNDRKTSVMYEKFTEAITILDTLQNDFAQTVSAMETA